MAGVAGQADHIAHGQDAAAAGEATSGGGLQLGQGGGHDDGGRQTVVLAEFSRGEERAQRRQQPVVVALGGGAGVVLDSVLGGWAVHTGGIVGGVAHAGRGQLGQHGLDGGAGFGGEPAVQCRHAVGLLLAQRHAALAGAVVVGEGAVGIEAIGEPIGQPGQLFGAILRAQPGQVGFGTVACRAVNPARQLVVELADHRHLARTELALPLPGGGGRQHRRQWFAGQSAPRAQVGGFADAPGCFGTADQRPFGQRMPECAAQFFRSGLAGKGIDQRMLYRRYPPTHPLTALQQRQPVRGGQRVEVQPGHFVDRGIQGIESRCDRLPINHPARTHNPKLSEPTDKNRR